MINFLTSCWFWKSRFCFQWGLLFSSSLTLWCYTMDHLKNENDFCKNVKIHFPSLSRERQEGSPGGRRKREEGQLILRWVTQLLINLCWAPGSMPGSRHPWFYLNLTETQWGKHLYLQGTDKKTYTFGMLRNLSLRERWNQHLQP